MGEWSWSLKFSADQPRVPAGSAEGGRWTSAGGGGAVASGAQGMLESQFIRDEVFKAVVKTDQTNKEQGGRIYREDDGSFRVEAKNGDATRINLGNPKGSVGCFHTHPSPYQAPDMNYAPPSPQDFVAHLADAWASGIDDYTSLTVAIHETDPGVTVFAMRGKGYSEPPTKAWADATLKWANKRMESYLNTINYGVSHREFRQVVEMGLKEIADQLGLEYWSEEWG